MFTQLTCHSELAVRLLLRSPRAKILCHLETGDGVRVCGMEVWVRWGFKADREKEWNEMKSTLLKQCLLLPPHVWRLLFYSMCVFVCARRACVHNPLLHLPLLMRLHASRGMRYDERSHCRQFGERTLQRLRTQTLWRPVKTVPSESSRLCHETGWTREPF